MKVCFLLLCIMFSNISGVNMHGWASLVHFYEDLRFGYEAKSFFWIFQRFSRKKPGRIFGYSIDGPFEIAAFFHCMSLEVDTNVETAFPSVNANVFAEAVEYFYESLDPKYQRSHQLFKDSGLQYLYKPYLDLGDEECELKSCYSVFHAHGVHGGVQVSREWELVLRSVPPYLWDWRALQLFLKFTVVTLAVTDGYHRASRAYSCVEEILGCGRVVQANFLAVALWRRYRVELCLGGPDPSVYSSINGLQMERGLISATSSLISIISKYRDPRIDFQLLPLGWHE